MPAAMLASPASHKEKSSIAFETQLYQSKTLEERRTPIKPSYDARRLPGGHGLGNDTLEGQLLLLEVVGRGVLDLELGHGVAESRLDLLLLVALELERHGGVRDDLLNTRDVGLELLAGLELLGEGLVGGLELGGILNHLVDLSGAELTNGVGDGDVGAAAGSLLGGGDLQDTVDIDLEDTLENGLTGTHVGDGCKSEFTWIKLSAIV